MANKVNKLSNKMPFAIKADQETTATTTAVVEEPKTSNKTAAKVRKGAAMFKAGAARGK